MSAYSHLDIIVNNIQECIDRCRTRGMSEHFISGLELAKSIVKEEVSSSFFQHPSHGTNIESSPHCNHVIV
jgi:hypothetical protein